MPITTGNEPETLSGMRSPTTPAPLPKPSRKMDAGKSPAKHPDPAHNTTKHAHHDGRRAAHY